MKLIKISIAAVSIMFITAIVHAEITVIKVEGSAAYKEGTKWIPLKTGQKLPEGVKVSTGANSSAELKLNSVNHTVKIKPLTMIQVFSKETKTDTNTHIGLKRGGVVAKVPREGKVKTIFKISSPIATSSVRGTEEDNHFGPARGMKIKMLKGEADGKNRNGQSKRLYGRLQFKQGTDSPKPENPLSDVKNGSLIQVSGNGLTPDELAAMQYSSDITGSPDDNASLIDNQLFQPDNGAEEDAKVNVTITWPK